MIIPCILAFVHVNIVNSQKEFLWGSATASYQIEGAVNEDGRGQTVWDEFSHTPGKTANGDTGDIATDGYHRYAEDLQLISNMGVNAYRFSIAWSRIVPDGVGEVNQAGIDHYNKVIDGMVAANIIPLATLFHWDTPLHLEEAYGGWLSADLEEHFTRYADICFNAFGDRVKNWLTFNEPLTVANVGYTMGTHAPGRCSDRSVCSSGNSTTESYIAAHNMLNAHASAAELYHTKYQAIQGGRIGITLNTDFAYPLTNSEEDVEAAERNIEFQGAWFADPVFFGRYPQSMVDRVGTRLPSFTPEQSERLIRSSDFYGLNHYTSKYVSNCPFSGDLSNGWGDDQETCVSKYDSNGNIIGAQAASDWLQVVPSGIHDILLWVQKRYNNPVILITENGVDVPGESDLPLEDALHDTFRIDFYSGYLSSVMQAMQQGVRVEGYFAWSLMDNFEWADGYNLRFGLHYVDYENGLTRYAKDSAKWFANYTKYYPLV